MTDSTTPTYFDVSTPPTDDELDLLAIYYAHINCPKCRERPYNDFREAWPGGHSPHCRRMRNGLRDMLYGLREKCVPVPGNIEENA